MNKLFFYFIPVIVLFAFSCNQGTKPGVSELSDDKVVVSEKEIPHPGETLYLRYCLACHQKDGSGVPGMHPTLTKTEWVLGDKDTLITIVLNGMTGPIEVNGEEYNSIMAPLNFISDQDLAHILTYVRSSFGNDASEITVEEVASVRADNKE